MKPPPIITVNPQAGRDAEQDALAISIGATKDACDDCTAPIWISPRTQEQIDVTKAKKLCMNCSVALRAMAQIGHNSPQTMLVILEPKKK